MSRHFPLFAVLTALALHAGPARADVSPTKVNASVTKGLRWLKKQGNRSADGMYWKDPQGRFTVPVTALAGIAFLMEGSTLREGAYSKEIRGAADYLLSKVRPNGLIGEVGEGRDGDRYMFGHGFGMLFLASLVGEEENANRRKQLAGVLEKAAIYCRDAQTKNGGWGYRSAKEDSNFDEGTQTAIQMQALRAIKNAGLAVPAAAIKDGVKYLKDSTNSDGGVRYSLTRWGGERSGTGLTAAAIVCGFSAGEYDSPLVKTWLSYLETHPPTRLEIDPEYSRYFYAHVMYTLGDDRFAKVFPKKSASKWMTWSAFKKENFASILAKQKSDGSFEGSGFGVRMAGPIYATVLNLSVLQLEKGSLPIYQR